jgi:RNA polymerase sigma-70 factor (ECF subfamily)
VLETVFVRSRWEVTRNFSPPTSERKEEVEGELAEAERTSDLEEQALQDLMVRYQRADSAATTELIRQVSPVLLRFLSGPIFTRAYAEDMLQECWLRIHKARHTYRRGDPLLPWIFAIARHTRVDGFRRRRRIEVHELAIDDFAPEPRQAGGSPGLPNLDLSRWIEMLPESQREVIFMLKVSGMSLEDVARATSSTVGAVKQKAHRAYETLRSRLSNASGVRPNHDLRTSKRVLG